MWSSRRTAAGLLLTAALSASACGYTAQAEGDGDQPAKVESINGSDQGKIILTANAAKRIGLKLTPVTEQTVNHDVVVRGTVVADPGSPTRAWIRVPIRSRELAAVDSTQPASILAGSGTIGIPATVSTKTPPGITVTAGRSLYLSTDTALGVPAGHQVRVQLQLPGGGTRETVPYSAVIYWVDGGTWVYARTRSDDLRPAAGCGRLRPRRRCSALERSAERNGCRPSRRRGAAGNRVRDRGRVIPAGTHHAAEVDEP